MLIVADDRILQLLKATSLAWSVTVSPDSEQSEFMSINL
jgi:hypothetical protein